MPIPKHVYQTCWTNKFHPVIESRFQKMRNLNPDYTFHLLLDEDLDNFVRTEYGGRIYESYKRLNIPAAKVDFWRYLFLYKYGGIYLDIDADISCSLNEIIKDTDTAIISAEGNPYMFVQWCLMFEKEHPILLQTILYVAENIENNKYPNDVLNMTGPGVFSRAIYTVQEQNRDYESGCPTHAQITTNTDWSSPNNIKYRIYGIDYGRKLACNVPEEYKFLYEGKTHWRHERKSLLL